MKPEIWQEVKTALAEDIGSGDLTAVLFNQQPQSQAVIVSRNDAIFCGQAWLNAVFLSLDPNVNIEWYIKDGDTIKPDQRLCYLRGLSSALLSGERTALNFIQTLSGTATITKQYVNVIADLPTKLLDTRKTIPHLRYAQKYAVYCGGGGNHRMGLYDAVLIKENHIQAVGSITDTVQALQQHYNLDKIQIEVESLAEMTQALELGIKHLLLDNFSLTELAQAVELNAKRAILEASGGITLKNIRSVAETGVNFISIGSLTKHIQAVDLSMLFQAKTKSP